MKNLRRLRLDAGLSAEELARLSGIHRAHIYAIEKGRRVNVTIATARGLAQGLAKATGRDYPAVLAELVEP